MATRTVTVTIKNTGTQRYTFWVGCTISTNVAGSGCDIWIPSGAYYKDLPPASITLDPGQTGQVRFTFDDATLDKPTTYSVPANATLYAIVKVWKSYDSATGMLKDCLDGTYKSFTAVGTPIVSAQITEITIT